MINRIGGFLPTIDNKRYESIQKRINEMLDNGSLNDCIIANAARVKLESTKKLQDYQDSPEWEKFWWGKKLVRLDGTLYYIGELRHEYEDFDKYPFAGYEVIGKVKLRLKRKSNPGIDGHADTKITWHGVKNMELVKSGFRIQESYKQINGGLK